MNVPADECRGQVAILYQVLWLPCACPVWGSLLCVPQPGAARGTAVSLVAGFFPLDQFISDGCLQLNGSAPPCEQELQSSKYSQDRLDQLLKPCRTKEEGASRGFGGLKGFEGASRLNV